MKIGNRVIASHHAPYVIAEAGANHNGSVELAFKLIEEAKKAGADCVKFQTYKTELFCEGKDKLFEYKSQGKKVIQSEFEMFKALEFDLDNWKKIIACCKDNDIHFMTTIQDPIVLDEMIPLGIDAIKVGSDDFDHILNLEYYFKSKLPLILSKGMADLQETKFILNFIRENNYAHNTCILHCVSLYPCDVSLINLNMIRELKALYPDFNWGFSDHTTSALTPSLSIINGACIIEKHFTLDHDLPGPDHWFSVDPKQLKELVETVSYAYKARGDGLASTPSDLHRKSEMRRRMIYNSSLGNGDFLQTKDVRFRRAKNGMYPSEIYSILGKPLLNNVNEGEYILKDHFNV